VSLTAIWSDGALAHDPEGEVWIGIVIEGDETPERGQVLGRVVDDLGIDVEAPTEHGDDPIVAIHDTGMLEYLRTAYDEWVGAGYPEDPGQDRVVAYAFRHPGAFGHVADRLPRSRTAMAGVYCMDTCTVIGPNSYRGIRYAVDAAIAANYLTTKTGTRVGVVDIDAHHGNGTQQIFYDRDDVVYTSVHVDPAQGWFPHWCGFGDETGAGDGSGYNRNFPLAPGAGDDEYVAALTAAVEVVVSTGAEILVVSLGVDAGASDPESPLKVTTEGFGMAAEVLAGMGKPTVLVQEGGYHLPALHRDLTAILTRFS
jgi:acetoin utilization deacetylase AcuC-like enzyme